MKYIKLTQNKRAIVDNEDFKELSKYKWFVLFNGRDYRAKRAERGRQIQMYNQIMKPSKGFEVDHINRRSLDNRRCNLRVVTNSQNQNNREVQKNNTSGITNVAWHKEIHKWCVQMRIKGKRYYFGSYKNRNEAVKVINNVKAVIGL